MDRKIVLTFASCLMVAACSSSPAARPTAAYSPGPGADAVDIAQHLAGCSGPKAGSAGGGAPDMKSTATCTLSGHLVIVDSFSSAAALTDLPAMSRGRAMYYAHGAGGWLAFLADQGATAETTTLQEQLTNDAADLLRESTDGDPHPPASLAAQQAVTAVIARKLRGAVGHVS